MADLASTDITIAITEKGRTGKKRWSRGTITFGDGALTTPAAGVPLPAIAQFGFARQLDTLQLFGINGKTTDYLLRYDKTNHKLLMYVSHDTAGATKLPMDTDAAQAPASRAYNFYAMGW